MGRADFTLPLLFKAPKPLEEDMMTAQVLVPLDGSPQAEQSLACAVALGQGLPAELILFHVVSIPSYTEEILSGIGLNASKLLSQLEDRAKEYLGGAAKRPEHAGLRVRQVIRHGLAAEAVVDYAQRPEVHLIAMTSHGYSGVRRWMHGSVAERVLQAASVPVLIVRVQQDLVTTSSEPMPCRRILVPLDGSPVAEQVLPPATSTARAFGAEVVLFQVPIVCVADSLLGELFLPLYGDLETAQQESAAYLSRVADQVEHQGVRVSTATQIGGVAQSILEYAEANRIDLIAMCTHGRTGMGRWTLGSVSDRVLRGGRVPMLLVRARGGEGSNSPSTDTEKAP
jgi:nucleotide-binding universal stress UspA family protein